MESVDLKMTTVDVNTSTRPLRAKWTSEMATDLSYYHGLISKMEYFLLNKLKSDKRKSKVGKIYGS
jgi:hypothetical protein